MLREAIHRLLRRLPLPCVLREGGHFDLITRFTEGGVWLERDCLRCGRVRRNGQVPPLMPFPPHPVDALVDIITKCGGTDDDKPVHIEPDPPWDRPAPTCDDCDPAVHGRGAGCPHPGGMHPDVA